MTDGLPNRIGLNVISCFTDGKNGSFGSYESCPITARLRTHTNAQNVETSTHQTLQTWDIGPLQVSSSLHVNNIPDVRIN